MSAAAPPLTLLVHIRPPARDLHIQVIVLDKLDSSTVPASSSSSSSSSHQISTFWVADESGSMVLSVWDQHIGRAISEGDILRIQKCEAKLFKGACQINAAPQYGCKISRFPVEDVLIHSEFPNYSHWEWRSDPSNPEKLVGYPPTVFPPHWYSKPGSSSSSSSSIQSTSQNKRQKQK